MDRTFKSNGNIYYFAGISEKIPLRKAFMQKSTELPIKSGSPFTLIKKLMIPKQINDRIFVSFSGDYTDIRVYAGKFSVRGDKNGLYDITPTLKRGRTVITLIVKGGSVTDFFVTVKRIKE